MFDKNQILAFLKQLFPTRRKTIVRITLAFLFIVIIWFATHINWMILINGYPDNPPVEIQEVQYDDFKFPIDSFQTESIYIRSDQFLSEILVNRGVSLQTIDKIATQYRYVFDVRKMAAGHQMKFYYSPDSLRRMEYMVYEKNPIEYVIYDFRDSLSVTLKQREVTTEIKYLEAEIGSSLWNAVEDKGVSIELVYEISTVFAWMIDVYSLNRGDQFEVIYEDQMVGNVSIGGKVLAARFKYSGKWIDAYQFIQNGQLGYFNEKGESLKRAFLKAPLDPKKVRISSRFSNSRMHPVLRIRRPHHGVDYAAPMGTPVVSIGDGKVIQRSFDKGSGNMVKIKHNSTYTSGYMHLSKFGEGVQVGSHVSQGQVIGYVGSTGLSTGPHLDFRVWQSGKPVDPLKIEAPPVEPIETRNKPAFDSVVKHYRTEFDRYKAELKGTAGTF